MELEDQREVSIPLSRYPTLARGWCAASEWQSIGSGQGFHWPELDTGLVGGRDCGRPAGSDPRAASPFRGTAPPPNRQGIGLITNSRTLIMLTEQEIRDALHARRVVPLPVPSPHGPLGLEQLAEAVAGRRLPTPSPPPASNGR